MRAPDRVAVVAWVWFLGLIGAGLGIGDLVGMPGSGAVWGFVVALVTVLVWPYVLPRAIERWMHDPL